VALSGLARPSSFEGDLARLGIELFGAWRGEDHWNPSSDEGAEIESWALGVGAKVLLCPEKNLERLRSRITRLPLFALSSSILWECDDPLAATGIRDYLQSAFGA
jgi:tetraacyldisaccharide-1-P 4'-kinase